MSAGLIAALACFGIAVAGVAFFKRRERRLFATGRVKMLLSQQYQESKLRGQASEEIFSMVVSKVGQFYGVDPEFLRDTDKLTDLSAMDSWALGSGESDLFDWLHSKGVLDVSKTATVADLIQAMSQPGR
jgi:hypothetical protein